MTLKRTGKCTYMDMHMVNMTFHSSPDGVALRWRSLTAVHIFPFLPSFPSHFLLTVSVDVESVIYRCCRHTICTGNRRTPHKKSNVVTVSQTAIFPIFQTSVFSGCLRFYFFIKVVKNTLTDALVIKVSNKFIYFAFMPGLSWMEADLFWLVLFLFGLSDKILLDRGRTQVL